MSGYVYDTNCLVALASADQQHHAATSRDRLRRQARGEAMVIAMHCAEEAYSVLTRSPPPLRCRPADAWVWIQAWTRQARLVDLNPQERLNMLRNGSELSIVGGQIHDFLIAACARKAGARTLVTWNLRHFVRWAGADLEIMNPLGERA